MCLQGLCSPVTSNILTVEISSWSDLLAVNFFYQSSVKKIDMGKNTE